MINYSFTSRFAVLKVMGLILAVLVVNVALSDVAHGENLTNLSPTPANMLMSSDTSIDDRTNHLLIHSDHGTVGVVELAAYYPVAGAKTITIYRGSGSLCSVYKGTGGSYKNPAEEYARVTFSNSANGRSLVYKISGNNICDASGTNNNAGDAMFKNKFFSNYEVPASLLANGIDPQTGKYKIRVRIQYVSVPKEVNKSTNQQVSFRVKVASSAAAGLVGNIDTNSTKNNSTVGRVVNPDGNMTQKFSFAYPCTDNGAPRNDTVTVYDADNGSALAQGSTTNKLRYYVEENGVPLAQNRYKFPQPNDSIEILKNASNIWVVEPDNGTSVDGTVVITKVDPNKKYTLIIYHVWTNGNNGANNFIYIGTPGDAIFGAGNFDCNAWNLSGGSKVGVKGTQPQSGTITANVWQTIVWQHSLTNTGPATANVTDRWRQRDFSGSFADFGSHLADSIGATVTKTYSYNAPADEYTLLPTDNGKTLCERYKAKPSRNGSNSELTTTPACVTVGGGVTTKSPKIQILGNDARVRGKVTTSTVFEAPKIFGSWVEYGIFSTEKNEALGSGAGLRNGNISSAQSEWSKLTFANTKEPEIGDLFGEYGLPEVPKIADYFDKLPGDTCASPLGNGIHSCGDVTLAGRAGINGTVIIKSSGTVTITGNMTYNNGPYASIGQLPQVVIIADHIIINENVSQVDAWLVTRDGGSIKTCGARDVNDPQLTKTVCASKLTMNGPVITDQLYLHRTYGSDGVTDATKSEPAEVFNLRPDAYLWAYQYGLARSQPITGSVTELPPRF